MKKKSFLTVFILFVCILLSFGQQPGSYTYDFRDGTIITNGGSGDSLTLSGTYSLHGDKYGLNMKENSEIDIKVNGSSTFKFLGSAYSSLSLIGTAVTEGDLGTQNTKVANDLSDTYDFVYDGDAATINFKAISPGSDVYLPTIEVIPPQAGGNGSLSAAEKNIIYYFDLRDESIVPSDAPGNTTIEQGLFKIEAGCCNAYSYHGTQHGITVKDGNKISLQVAGNSYIRVGGDAYSGGTITATSTTGSFDVSAQSNLTGSTFSDSSPVYVDFLYAGTAGTVELNISGSTSYIPYIEILPVPYDVELTPWVVKTGTITVNGTEISYTAGADANSDPTVTVSDGLVNSATTDGASIRINLGGNALDSYTPTFTGDIETVTINGDTLNVTLSDSSSNPTTYTIIVADNSSEVTAEAGKTYTYNFADGSVLPQTSYQALRYTTFITNDGILTMNSNTDTESLQFGYHDASHGAVLFPGNSMDLIVAGNATITFVVCTYGSATDAVFEFTDADSNVLGSIAAQNIGEGDAFASSFTYTGPAEMITANLLSTDHATAEIYIHGLTIENAAAIDPSNGKTDVWDFGAEQLDESTYNNNLNDDIINAWYDGSITAGSSGNVLPNFTAGVLSWVGGGNDRLRTSNTNLTRYDENLSSVTDYTGRVYVNSSAATGRYMSMTLSEDDEVTIVALTQNGSGRINFQYVADPVSQTDQAPVGSDIDTLHFVAKAEGTYHIFDDQDKPSYYRIYRKDALYAALTGSVDETAADGIPSGYGIVFTNDAGKSWTSIVSSGSYSANLPVGYTYKLSLSDANGYIISNGNSLEVTEATTTYDITVQKVELFTVTGSITGLGDKLANLELTYTPDPSTNKIFNPQPVIDADGGTYSVELEPNCKYMISAQGINDYYLPKDSITIGQADETADLAFAAKPVYNVTFTTDGLTAEQKAKLQLTFTNLNEEGYTYDFTSVDDVALRDGTYTIMYDGLDEYAVEMGLTSNLTIDGAATSKTLAFTPVKNWSFDDKVIANGTPAYKGLLFTGTISNEIAKGHLSTKPDATIQVPVNPGDKIRVTYYYAADFSIDGGDAYTTSSGSTSTLEYADYSYTGSEAGYVTITIGSGAGTTYLTNIAIDATMDYQSVIYVGTDKEYKTINEALNAISKMVRNDDERVTVMIDPGNYEEMFVLTSANVTLKNAATTPSIALKNKGVDIDDNAVRITSYYGHGYSYYSMGSNQKWDADILRVNKENGYLSYANKGAGTTNGSYWNATVVITASGFEADDIIFENSFNQYISQKESEDVVVMWESGSKGERPLDYGNTAVQDRSFVERAAAIAFTSSADKVILNKCRVIGRQDSFYGSSGARAVMYKGAMMGAVDYIFGGMTAVFYKSDLVMNTSDVSSDASYLTAAQQSSGRGYLMYECNVTSTVPGVETASSYGAKPGYFGRPWQATTSEVVFYNTNIGTSDYPGNEGQSLIAAVGWTSSLGGESTKMYEFGTVEESGENNQSSRASWSTVLTEPTLTDGTEITTFNFTKGNDGWDPLPDLIANDPTGINQLHAQSKVNVYAWGNKIYISNVKSDAVVNVYSVNGALIKVLKTRSDTNFNLEQGLWVIRVIAADGQKAVKVVTR